MEKKKEKEKEKEKEEDEEEEKEKGMRSQTRFGITREKRGERHSGTIGRRREGKSSVEKLARW